MNICVCVKYVPGEVELIFRDDHSLSREEMTGVINPFDLYAMEAASRIKDHDEQTRIIALTMGPRQARKALKECLAVGADDVYLLTDPALKGADVSTTANALAAAIRSLEKTYGSMDAIFCGSKTIDGNTSQLGIHLANALHMPAVTFALTAENQEASMSVLVENDEGNRVYEVKKPALLTFTKAEFTTRYPQIERIIEAEKTEIPEFSLADIHGSIEEKKTQILVEEAGFAPTKKQGLMIQEKQGEDSAKKLAGILFEEHLL